MKKIGTVTFHESNNYGTCLQAFALRKFIQDNGFDCEIINYKRNMLGKENKKSTIYKIAKILKNYNFKLYLYPLNKKIEYAKAQLFNAFRENYYVYSKKQYTDINDLSECNEIYDGIVCGSDMIWCENRVDNMNIYMLAFIDGNKRIAYAPSFGEDVTQNTTYIKYIPELNKFKALSCREKEGKKFIEDYCNKDVTSVCDPTLLVSKKIWNEVERKVDVPDKYILCYLFQGIDSKMLRNVKKIAKQMKCEIRFIPMTPSDAKSKYAIRQGIGPQEFLYLINNAELVITNSYHGLMFSLIFEKNFVLVHRNKNSEWNQFENRMESLVKQFDISDNFVRSDEICWSKENAIDYEALAPKFNRFKDISSRYLLDALNSI